MCEAGVVVLWRTFSGMRCTFVRRGSGPPFEITITCGPEVITRRAFEHDEDAAAFAITEMHAVDRV